MAAFNNDKNICYLHRYQYYWQFPYEDIFTHGPAKLSKTEIVLPTYQLYNVTCLIKTT